MKSHRNRMNDLLKAHWSIRKPPGFNQRFMVNPHFENKLMRIKACSFSTLFSAGCLLLSHSFLITVDRNP